MHSSSRSVLGSVRGHPADSEADGTSCTTHANEPSISLTSLRRSRWNASNGLHFAFVRVSASVQFRTDSNYVSYWIPERNSSHRQVPPSWGWAISSASFASRAIFFAPTAVALTASSIRTIQKQTMVQTLRKKSKASNTLVTYLLPIVQKYKDHVS